MKSLSYSDQLKQPAWRERKAQLIEARGQLCEDCGIKTKVEPHHKYYESGRMAWDYPDDCFKLLCRDCHQLTTEALLSFNFLLGEFSGNQLVDLSGSMLEAIVDAKAEFGSEQGARVVFNWLMFCASHRQIRSGIEVEL